jgi:hypothetical protein
LGGSESQHQQPQAKLRALITTLPLCDDGLLQREAESGTGDADGEVWEFGRTVGDGIESGCSGCANGVGEAAGGGDPSPCFQFLECQFVLGEIHAVLVPLVLQLACDGVDGVTGRCLLEPGGHLIPSVGVVVGEGAGDE